MPEVPGSWNDNFLSYHLPFSFLLGFFFHRFQCSTPENKRAIQTFFSSMQSSWFYSLLDWNLLVLSLVLVEGLMRGFFRSNVYLSNISIGLIFSLCLHIKKHKNRPNCSRQGIANYLCHTNYTTWIFLLSYHFLSALTSLVHIMEQMPDEH